MGYKERGSDGKMIPINYLTGVRQMGSLVLALDPEPVVPQQIAGKFPLYYQRTVDLHWIGGREDWHAVGIRINDSGNWVKDFF
jgi:hypothetical protein